MGSYAASKAGLIGLTRSLASGHAAAGTRYNALLPDGTITRIAVLAIRRMDQAALPARPPALICRKARSPARFPDRIEPSIVAGRPVFV